MATVTTITEAGGDDDPRGITWLPDGTLVYASVAAGPLLQVPSTGGMPRALTILDEKTGERTHRWPSALPGGKAVLFTVGTLGSPDNYDRSTIEAIEVATGQRHNVPRVPAPPVMSAPDISSSRVNRACMRCL